MANHEFGGPWTEEKLSIVQGYFEPYIKIFKRNEVARRTFQTIYIDAFAGSGSREEKDKEEESPNIISLFELFGPPQNDQIPRTPQSYKGSARLALEVVPPFDKYIFIERKREFVTQLHALCNEFPDRPLVDIRQSEAKAELQQICQTTDWKKWRAIAFLDPYGMQVDWHTITCIAETKGIDLWLLWPIGQAINRLLPRDKMPDQSWERALDSAFGTQDWRGRFYAVREEPRQVQTNLFADEGTPPAETSAHDYRKVVNIDGLTEYFLERLNTIFPFVARKPRLLVDTDGRPLYLLCFASHKQAAFNIAEWLLKK